GHDAHGRDGDAHRAFGGSGLPRELVPARLPPAEAGMMRRERGVALVLVMWAAVLLTVIASSFIIERRTETLVVGNSISIARAEGYADAGVAPAVYEMYRTDNSPDAWKRDGTAQNWS